MGDSYASATLGGEGRNVEALGVFVAWLVANDLLDPAFAASAGAPVTRLRMQDLNGAEFLTTVMHGELAPHQLTDDGRRFTESYFLSGEFQRDYDAVDYTGSDEWHRYDLVAPRIRSAWQKLHSPLQKIRSTGAKILQFPGRKRS